MTDIKGMTGIFNSSVKATRFGEFWVSDEGLRARLRGKAGDECFSSTEETDELGENTGDTLWLNSGSSVTMEEDPTDELDRGENLAPLPIPLINRFCQFRPETGVLQGLFPGTKRADGGPALLDDDVESGAKLDDARGVNVPLGTGARSTVLRPTVTPLAMVEEHDELGGDVCLQRFVGAIGGDGAINNPSVTFCVFEADVFP